jgi:hypothetical protein
MNAWIVILAAGSGSYLFRLSMIILTGWGHPGHSAAGRCRCSRHRRFAHRLVLSYRQRV